TKRLEAWLTRYMKSLAEDGKRFTLFNRDSDLHDSLVRFVSKVNNDTFKENEDLIMDYLRDSERFTEFCSEVDKASAALMVPKSLMDEAESILSAINEMPPKTADRYFKSLLEKFISKGWDAFDKGLGKTIVKISEDGKGMWTQGALKAGLDDAGLTARSADFATRVIDAYNRRITLKVIRDNLYQMGLLSAVMKMIDNFRVENSTLLLSDTNSLLSKVIGNEDSPFLYEKIGTRFRHYLIDEFQDTSLSQWNNMRLLLKESLAYGHDNLVIGDEKQCIYRFRNSDPTLLQNLHKESWVGDAYEARGGAVSENTNWRSSVEVIRFNNSLFSAVASFYGLTDVYANVIQAIPDKNLDRHGYVKVSLTDKDDDAALDNMASEMKRQLTTG
ncbi:MAG: UvrD-helicase domain-containing protein, partial [Duncaniella sp.]|nr:UvrD-helicase domain-containing protein [Duncaniella sp.]